MQTVLITGASRGLGLEFTRQFAADGWKVIATCRNPDTSTDLKKISGNVNIIAMDITDSTHIKAVASELKHEAIDVLINNAAVHGPYDEKASFGDIDIAAWLKVMQVNVIGPLKVTEAFIEHIKISNKKTIVFISSQAGSISQRGLLPHHKPGGSYIYRSSKAALNAITQSLAFDLSHLGIGIVVLHPGFVKTKMAEKDATIDVKTSIAGMRNIIENFIPADSKKFFNYNGEVIPW